MSKARPRPQAESTPRHDLVVLAADKDTSQAVEGLLRRPEALQVRPVSFEAVVHPQHDPGCQGNSAGLLALYRSTHRYALVIFDREGCGREQLAREDLEALVESQLVTAGWQDRCAVVVIDPELENWVWSSSPHVPAILGWAKRDQVLPAWLVDQGFLEEATQRKPGRPKEAVEAVLREVRKARSSALYKALANQVSLAGCQDPAFRKFCRVLRGWFPPLPRGSHRM